jgi:hypothetical protein
VPFKKKVISNKQNLKVSRSEILEITFCLIFSYKINRCSKTSQSSHPPKLEPFAIFIYLFISKKKFEGEQK